MFELIQIQSFLPGQGYEKHDENENKVKLSVTCYSEIIVSHNQAIHPVGSNFKAYTNTGLQQLLRAHILCDSNSFPICSSIFT